MEAIEAPADRYDDAIRLILSDHPEAQLHGRGTARVAIDAALALGFSHRATGRIGLAATLHDIGKTLISERILNKPGPLDPDEWVQIRLHPVLGEQMLMGEGLLDIAPWVRSHHERIDGFGYPDGLQGDAIPIEARILACADAYDAMTTHRAYRPAMSAGQARKEIALATGTQFDPKVVAAVLRCTAEDAGVVRMAAPSWLRAADRVA